MPVEITNLTQRPVLMRLNSGTSLHLSPGARSSKIVDAEVSNNEKVKKLQERHIIAMDASPARVQKAPARKRAGKKAPARKRGAQPAR